VAIVEVNRHLNAWVSKRKVTLKFQVENCFREVEVISNLAIFVLVTHIRCRLHSKVIDIPSAVLGLRVALRCKTN
jgi:hypothetical protein